MKNLIKIFLFQNRKKLHRIVHHEKMTINADDPYEKKLVTALANMGHDITDRTVVFCDICNANGKGSKGGVVMLDKAPLSANMGPTFACTQCFEEFTCKSPRKRKLRPNTTQATALRRGVGTDPEWYMKLDPELTFYANVIKLRKNPKKYGGLGQPWECEIDVKKSIEISLEKIEAKGTNRKSKSENANHESGARASFASTPKDNQIKYAPYAICAGCSEAKPAHELKMCTGCRLARYCNVECQRIDWNQGHKNNCKKLFS